MPCPYRWFSPLPLGEGPGVRARLGGFGCFASTTFRLSMTSFVRSSKKPWAALADNHINLARLKT
jgi:hypothetical protein